MTKYELDYSQFLADITQQILEFIKNNYNVKFIEEKKEQVVKQEPQNEFVNVDNDKVELVEYYNNSQTKPNKTILYIVGAIIAYSLLRGK